MSTLHPKKKPTQASAIVSSASKSVFWGQATVVMSRQDMPMLLSGALLAWADNQENGDSSVKRKRWDAAVPAHLISGLLIYRFAWIVSVLVLFWNSKV